MHDIHYALRAFARAPGFAAAAVLSLSLGIGANVTIYTIANAFLNQPVHGARNPDRLARVYRGRHSPLQYRDLAYVRNNSKVFAGVAGERMTPVAVRNGSESQREQAAIVTEGYFDMLRVTPQIGRLFGEIDSTNSEAVAISDALWERRFQRDPNVLGSRLWINDHPFTVVGVLPREFVSSIFLWRADLWFPPGAAPTLMGSTFDRWSGSLYVTARLAPGRTLRQADAELRVLAAQLRTAEPQTHREFTLRAGGARGVTEELRGPATAASGFLLFVVALVLLIACANVANLLLARAAGRRREIAVRIAMGARRMRLIRQLMTEYALLSVIASIIGIAAAAWTANLLARFVISRSPEPIALDFSPDSQVLLYTLVIAVTTTLLFGLMPAFRATSVEILPVLREESLQASGRSRMRSTLIGAQVALCTILLACATLFIRSLANARVIDPGFATAGIVDVSIDLRSRNLSPEEGAVFYRALVERAKALPGVRSVSLAALVPLGGSNMQTRVYLEGDDSVAARGRVPYFNVVSADYFSTLGIPILGGRGLTGEDDARHPPVVVVNERMAQRYWPSRSAIGQRISISGAAGPWATVVGIARNTKYNSLGEAVPEYMYLPFEQHYRSEMVLHVRAGDVVGLRKALSSLVRELDPALPPVTASTMSDDMRIVLLPAQLGASLLGAFGFLALVLACVGIYGVTSFSVAQRTRELGIRSALGATARDVLTLILGQTLRVVVIGAVIGLAAALAVARLIESQLYGVTASDPAAFLGMPLVLIAIAAVATLVPARRASRVDPIDALRTE